MKKHSFCKLRSATAFSLLLALAPFFFSASALASESPAPGSEQEQPRVEDGVLIVTPEPEESAAPEVTPEPEPSEGPEETPEPETSAEPEETPEPEASEEPEITPEPEATEEPEPVPSLFDQLDIDWGAPDFVYSRKWLPREHRYEGSWAATDDRIATIVNRGESALTLELRFVPQLSGVGGTILRDVENEDGTVEAVPLAEGLLTLTPGESATVRLAIAGDPIPEELGGAIGAVELNVSPAEG